MKFNTQVTTPNMVYYNKIIKSVGKQHFVYNNYLKIIVLWQLMNKHLKVSE